MPKSFDLTFGMGIEIPTLPDTRLPGIKSPKDWYFHLLPDFQWLPDLVIDWGIECSWQIPLTLAL
jgi:hypothetical protein